MPYTYSPGVLATEFVSLGAQPGGGKVRVSMRHNGQIKRHSSYHGNDFSNGLEWGNAFHREIAGFNAGSRKIGDDSIEVWLTEEAVEHFKSLSFLVKKAYARFQAKGGLEAQTNKHEIGVRLRRIRKNLLECYEHGMDDDRFDEFVQEVKAEAILKS